MNHAETSLPPGSCTYKRRTVLIKILLMLCIFFVLMDTGYRVLNGISVVNKEECIVQQMMPKPLFTLFENIVELPVIIFLSIFLGIFFQQLFLRLRIPFLHGPLSTFVMASLLPVCSCSSVSLISGIGKVCKLRNAVIFFIAAPLLNPFIILMSANILGIQYCLLRITGAFFLSLSAGYLIQFIQPDATNVIQNRVQCAKKEACRTKTSDIYIKGLRIFKGLIPFFLFGAGLSIAFTLLVGNPLDTMKGILQSVFSKIGIILLGIPLYICGGADILILKPLIHGGLPTGTALSFSLTSASVCIPSLLMISRFLGKKTVFILTIYLVVFCLAYGELINVLLR